ncbi:hypothetical protein NJ76_29025 [Rhodococcus sp. IITR03]|nr:hypothetical protein NJ76_29025 [Rhodococcus sp. IITR03]
MSSTATPDYADIAGRLFGIWDQMLDAGTFTVINDKPSDAEKATRVLALAHHVRRLGAAALDLIESHGPLVAAPTIRSCFEYALTAMWIAQSTDAVQAWIAQDPASRRASSRAYGRPTVTSYARSPRRSSAPISSGSSRTQWLRPTRSSRWWPTSTVAVTSTRITACCAV